jgi:hypothetical protein
MLIFLVPSRGVYKQLFILVEQFLDDKTKNKITVLDGRSECHI